MATHRRKFAECVVYYDRAEPRKVRKKQKISTWTCRCHRCSEPLKESDSEHSCPHGRPCVPGETCSECVAFMARQLTLDELVERE